MSSRPAFLSETPVSDSPVASSNGRPAFLSESDTSNTAVAHPDIQNGLSNMMKMTQPEKVNEAPVTFPKYDSTAQTTKPSFWDKVKSNTSDLLWDNLVKVGLPMLGSSSVGSAGIIKDVAVGGAKDIATDVSTGNVKDLYQKGKYAVSAVVKGASDAVNWADEHLLKPAVDAIASGSQAGGQYLGERAGKALGINDQPTHTLSDLYKSDYAQQSKVPNYLTEGISYLTKSLSQGEASVMKGSAEAQTNPTHIVGEVQNSDIVDKMLDIPKNYWNDLAQKNIKEYIDKKVARGEQPDTTLMENIAQNIPNLAGFFLLGGGVRYGAGKLVAKEVTAETLAGVSNTIFEAGMEADQTKQSLLQQGKSERDASVGALNTFSGNLALIPVTNKIGGMFEENTYKGVKRLFQYASTGAVEGGQEAVQQMVQNTNSDRPIMEGVSDNFLVGAVMGLGSSAVFQTIAYGGDKLAQARADGSLNKMIDEDPTIPDDKKAIVKKIANGTITEAEKEQLLKENVTDTAKNNATGEFNDGSAQHTALVNDVKTAIDSGSRISAVTSAIVDQYNVSPEYADSIVQKALAEIHSVPTTEVKAQEDTTTKVDTSTANKEAVTVKQINKKIADLTKQIPDLPKGSVEKKNAKLALETERAKLRTLKTETQTPVKATEVKTVESKQNAPESNMIKQSLNDILETRKTQYGYKPSDAKGDALQYNALIRGMEGRPTTTEKNVAEKYLASAYVSKPVVVNGIKGIVIATPSFGKSKIRFEDGTEKSVPIKSIEVKKITGKDVIEHIKKTSTEKAKEQVKLFGNKKEEITPKSAKTVGEYITYYKEGHAYPSESGLDNFIDANPNDNLKKEDIIAEFKKTEKPVTQKEAVKKVVEKKGKATIKEIADETGILEPNVRRILGMGAKEGDFKRVDSGVYTITTPDGKEVAVVIPADAVETLPKLASEGFKSDMVFLDIPYDTPAVKGGNRGVDYNLISVEDFGKVLDALKTIMKEKTSPVIHMFSQAESGLKQMQKYNDLFLEKGFIPVGRGEYQKTYKDGSPVAFPTVHGSMVTKPEGIIVFTQSGEVKKDLGNLNFRLVRPKGYATEKHADMLKSLIEMTTSEGDVILDPFAGSGVTGEEAVKAGRKAVLIEKDKTVAETITRPRVQRAVKQVPLTAKSEVISSKKSPKSVSPTKKEGEVGEQTTVSVPLESAYNRGTPYNKDFTISLNGDVSYNGEVITHIYDGQITAKQIEALDYEDKLSNGDETFHWADTTQTGNAYQEVADKINEAYKKIKDASDKALLENYARVFPEKTATEEVASSVPKGKITDVGEKIGGAKKDIWGKAQESYSMNFTDAEIAKRKLSELFPKLDYKKLSENGVGEETLARIAWANSLIAKKPVRSYAVAKWVEQVKVIRGMIQDLLENKKTTEHFNTVLDTMPSLKASFETTKKMYKELDFINNPEVAKYTLSSKQYTTRDTNGEKKTVDYYTISKQSKSVKSFYPEEGQTVESLMTKVKDFFTQLESKKAEKGTSTEVDIKKYIGLYNNRLTGKVYSAYKKGKTFFEFETFNNIDEARTLYRTPERIAQYIKQLEEAVRFDEESFRTGESNVEGKRSYRTGNVSAEEFQKTFGFRGVEFGNWVNQSEREVRLNKAFDSFKDLASLLGIPDEAISLNGELGFAFGARGSKGALAHYESGKVVINITKLGGAGTLAHEWFHALDNYLSRRDGSAFSFATEDGYNRADLDTKLKAIVDYIKNGDIGRRSQRADNLKNKVYYGQIREMTARGFEVYVKEKLAERGLSNTFLVSLLDAKDVSPSFNDIYPYAVGDEIKKVTNLYQDMVDTLMNREDSGKVALYKYKSEALNNNTPTVSGAFLKDASERLKIDFDYKFFDAILGQQKKSAWGVTLGGSVGLEKSAPFITERHEFVHLTLKNMDKIDALKGISKYDLLMEQTKKMGLPIEMYQTAQVEEALAQGIEKYEKGQITLEKGSKIKQFYHYLIDQFKKVLKAIGLSKGNIINDYYDILLYEESVNTEYTKLSDGHELDAYIRDNTLDLSSLPEVSTSDENGVKMKEKITQVSDEINSIIKDIESNREVMTVISRYADGKPLTEVVQIANSQVEDYVKAVLEIEKIKQDITDASKLFSRLVEKRENIEDLQTALENKLVVITTKTHGTKGRSKTAVTSETVIANTLADNELTKDETATELLKKMSPKKKVETTDKKISAFQHRMLDLLSEQNKDDVMYDVMHKVEEVAKAEAYYEANKKRTIDMALGKEAVPEGISSNVIALTVLQKAQEAGDNKTISRVLPKLSLRATKQGQEIAMLANAFGERDPISYMNKLIAMRKEIAKKKYKPFFTSIKDAKSIDDIVQEKVKLARKKAPKLSDLMQTKVEDINSFLDEIKC